MTYSEAYEELQALIEELKSEDISLDEMKEKMSAAKKLITFCQKKLRDIEVELEESLEED